jgi:iron complex outermembrane receptor protein
MKLRGIESGRDLNALVPNVVVAGGGSGQANATIIMRGIPGVGVYLDGVWQGDRGLLQTNFVEMERVEVLRGPQGTLFGRNTNGGAIQYVSRRPAEEFGASFDMALGNYERRDIKGSVDLPLGDKFFTKFSAARLERAGYIESLATTRPDTAYGAQDDTLFRADLLWQASDRFDARLVINSIDQFSTDGRQTRFTNELNRHLQAYNAIYDSGMFDVPGGPFTPEQYEAGYPGGIVGKWESRSNMPDDGIFQNVEDATLTLEWDITDNLHLRSITADRRRESRQLTDWDGMEAVVTFTDDRNYDDNLFSQEFHLTGTGLDGRMSFLVGAYYSDEENKFRQYRWSQNELHMLGPNGNVIANPEMIQYIRDVGAATGNATLANYSPLTGVYGVNGQWTLDALQDTAIFGELGFDITDKLNLTLGMRWSSREDKTTTYNADPQSGRFLLTPPEFGGGHGPGDIYTGTVRSVSELPDFGTDSTPKLSLAYHISDDVMVYGSYAEGFTQGDISYSTFNNFFVELKPEVVSTYEIGLRSDWLNDTLRLNANIFTSDWDGLRVPILPVDPVTGEQLPFPYNTDEGKAEASGIEVELIWAATDNLRFNASIGKLDTKYLEVGDPASSPLRIGAPFQYAPENTASIGIQHDHALASGAELTFRGDYGWMDEYQRDAAAQRQPVNPDGSDRSEPAYGLLNLRVRYTSADNSWSASLFGTNLTDERYVNGGFDARNPFGLDFIVVGRPREWGASLQFNLD